MLLSTSSGQVIGGVHAVRCRYTPGGELTLRVYLRNRLESQLCRPSRPSVGSGSLLHPLYSNFSTSTRLYTKGDLATKLKAKLETVKPKQREWRMIEESNPNPKSKPASPRLAAEILEKHDNLHKMYYETVAEEDTRLWLRHEAIRGIPSSIYGNWERPPRTSHDQKIIGFRRRFGNILEINTHASVPSTRKQLTRWDQNACQELAPLFKDMMQMRATLARLCGFKSYFEFSSQDKMMDQKSVKSFLDKLKDKLTPHIKSHMEDLLEMKLKDMDIANSFSEVRRGLQKHGQTISDFQEFHGVDYQLHWGEVAYYSRLQLQKNVLSDESIDYCEYFELKSTVRKLLPVFGHVFGLSFAEITTDGLYSQPYGELISRYLEGKKVNSKSFNREKLLVFDVYDTTPEDGTAFLGILVLDLIKRDRKSLRGFCQDLGYVDFERRSTKRASVILIHANFNPPESKLPTLLNNKEIETLAHELGHAIHNFVRGDTEGVPRDAIEIPSILLEHWVRDPRILQKLSSHYVYQNKKAYLVAWESRNPSRPLPLEQAPLDTFDPIVLASHPRNRILDYQSALWKAKFDLMVNSYSEKDLESANLGVDCENVLREWTGIFGLGDGTNNSYLTWHELDNYSTSYYTYLLAEVYTLEIFKTHFAQNPLNRKKGLQFRKIFLEHRDWFPDRTVARDLKRNPLNRLYLYYKLRAMDKSENTMDALVKFMGRKPSMNPFVKALNAPLRPRKPFWKWVRGHLVTAWKEAGEVRRFVVSRRGQEYIREKARVK